MLKRLKPKEFKKIMQDDAVFVIDVRTSEQEQIEGTDASIPYDEIKDSTNKLPGDKDTPLAVYCDHGITSTEAAKILADMGYTQIYELEGGMTEYIEEVGN